MLRACSRNYWFTLPSAGKGLGRKENGITQALKVTLKQDTHGVRLGRLREVIVDGRGDP